MEETRRKDQAQPGYKRNYGFRLSMKSAENNPIYVEFGFRSSQYERSWEGPFMGIPGDLYRLTGVTCSGEFDYSMTVMNMDGWLHEGDVVLLLRGTIMNRIGADNKIEMIFPLTPTITSNVYEDLTFSFQFFSGGREREVENVEIDRS